jgi:ribosomal protein S18 acetylase RimI-like enzyme
MKSLYRETSIKTPISDKNINKTFSKLLHNPEKGRILILEKEKQIVGYCLLVNFWSNEYGGTVVIIDEIYIKHEFRGKNIGTSLIKSLIKNKFMKAVVLQLEVKPSNIKVIKVYKKIGFKLSKNTHLIYHSANKP